MNDDLEEDDVEHFQEQDDHEVFTVSDDVEDADKECIQKEEGSEATILAILALIFINCEILLFGLLNPLYIISPQ